MHGTETGTTVQSAGNGADTTATATRTASGTTTTGDAELTVLTKISKLLNSLDDGGRSRIVRYLAEKFEADLG